jgi:hypothetical protein
LLDFKDNIHHLKASDIRNRLLPDGLELSPHKKVSAHCRSFGLPAIDRYDIPR